MNLNNYHKVTVCIPVYNGSAYIAEAIESVLTQTYRDFQLLIVDNCSTDNTEEIVSSYKDPRITFIRNEKNLGLVGNANRCLELADGEYIYIFHHDDIMLPHNIEYKVRLLDEHPDVGFVHSNLILIDTNGKVIANNIWYKGSRKDYIEDGITAFHKYVEYLPFGASIFIGAVLARKSCYEKVGEFNPELPHCNDSEMWMKMMLHYKIACIGEPLVKYRVHSISTSSSWGDHKSLPYLKEHYQAMKAVFRRYKNHIPKAKDTERKVSLAFGVRSLQLSINSLANRDVDTARSFFKESLRFSPLVFKKTVFYKSLFALLTGYSSIRFYKAARNVLRGGSDL